MARSDVFEKRFIGEMLFSSSDIQLRLRQDRLIKQLRDVALDAAKVLGSGLYNPRGQSIKLFHLCAKELVKELPIYSLESFITHIEIIYDRGYDSMQGNVLAEKLAYPLDYYFKYSWAESILRFDENKMSLIDRNSKLIERLSLIELFLREIESSGKNIDDVVNDLNERLNEYKMGVAYNKGYFHKSPLPAIQIKTRNPCWNLLTKPEYASVQDDLHDSLNCYDEGDINDAIQKAGMAFEGMMKAILDKKGLLPIKVNGAKHLIDTLKGNNIITKVEQDWIYEGIFRPFRNPASHGGPKPIFTNDDANFVINECMNWIVYLEKRI